MDNPVVWFEIYVDDMERARTFYAKVFGYAFTKLESPGLEMWSFPMKQNGAGAAGALAKMDGCKAGGQNVVVYFRCDDCALEADRAAAAGGRIERPKTSIGAYGHIALVRDTEGNLIGLHSTA